MMPGQVDNGHYKQITLQSDYDRDGKLILAYDDQGDIYIQTEGFVRFANTSSSFVCSRLKEHLIDLVNDNLSDIAIGTEVVHEGKTYVCKPALTASQKNDPDEECEGCAFKDLHWQHGSPCCKYYCVDSERSDNKDIRFVEKVR